MTLQQFFKLVEIRTKVASVLPFLFGLFYAWYAYGSFKPIPLILFFLSMISIDMATTALNNYHDHRRAVLKEGYNYEEHNAVSAFSLEPKRVLTVIIGLIGFGALCGIGLTLQTDAVVFLIGFVGFGIGVLYSYGPIPISRTPLGELASGIVMGGFIPFVAIYSQIFDKGLIILSLHDWILKGQVDLLAMVYLILLLVPFVLLIANIMLANNLCDLEDDLINKRYTLPFYIGKVFGLGVYFANILISYGSVLLAIILGILPLTSLLVFFTLIKVWPLGRLFYKTQDKANTFVTSVQTFVMVAGSLIVTIILSLIIQ